LNDVIINSEKNKNRWRWKYLLASNRYCISAASTASGYNENFAIWLGKRKI